MVQPGVFDGPDGAERRFARGEELTRALAGRDVDLVVWGESSVGADLAARPDLSDRLAALSRELGAEILVNVDARRSDLPGIYKSSVLVDAGARPATGTTRCGSCPSASTCRRGRCWAGPRRWAAPRRRTAGAASVRS